jgi:hypothetical protein
MKFNRRHQDSNFSISDQNDDRSAFNIMFRITGAFIALVFVLGIAFAIAVFTGHAPFNYHYEVTQTWGDHSYHQEYSTGE